jgi:uncharacterized membrane protein
MDKMIVIVFDSDPAAYAGGRALKELHWEGSITLYSGSLIAKDSSAKIHLKQVINFGLIGSVLGRATAALVGALAEDAGSTALKSSDWQIGTLQSAGISEEFFRHVARAVRPGKLAIVAEVEEDWITPLDSLMEMLGGVVFRRPRAELLDTQLEREVMLLHAEALHLQDELSHVVGAAKTKLQLKEEEARSRLEQARDRAQRRIDAIMLEAEAKVRSLQEQAAGAAEYAKANIERRIADIQADYQMRSHRLGRAWQLVLADR